MTSRPNSPLGSWEISGEKQQMNAHDCFAFVEKPRIKILHSEHGLPREDKAMSAIWAAVCTTLPSVKPSPETFDSF